MSKKDFTDELTSRAKPKLSNKKNFGDSGGDCVQKTETCYNNNTNRSQNNEIEDDVLQAKDQLQSALNAISNKVGKTQIGHNKGSNKAQDFLSEITRSVPDRPISKKFIDLKGNAKKIILLIYQICKINNSNSTVELSREDISRFCSMKFSSVKTTLQRLVKYGCINRSKYSSGPLGGTRYELPYAIYQEMAMLEVHNLLDLDFLPKTAFELGTETRTLSGTKILSRV